MPKEKWYAKRIESLGAYVKSEIIQALREEEPLTITALSRRTNFTWKTVQRRLNELISEGKVVLREIEGCTKLFFLNPEFKEEVEHRG
jgi:predicted transcriptional regulator